MLYEALLKDIHKLNVDLAAHSAATSADSESFAKLADLNQQLHNKEQQLLDDELECSAQQQHLQFVALHLEVHPDNDVQTLFQELRTQHTAAVSQKNTHRKEQQQLKADVDKHAGGKELARPCEQSLETVLQNQAYHGGAFIDNHVH